MSDNKRKAETDEETTTTKKQATESEENPRHLDYHTMWYVINGELCSTVWGNETKASTRTTLEGRLEISARVTAAVNASANGAKITSIHVTKW